MHRISEVDPVGGIPRYQLKITLVRSKPAIWRRVVTPANIKLDRLHRVIQCVMPWTDSHLHQFIVGRIYYSLLNPEFDEWGANKPLNEKRYTLADLAPAAKSKFAYEYDFGDSWHHQVLVEKILPPDGSIKHAICLAGANACPPEDCGGIFGYYNLLQAVADPKHPDHVDLTEWLGGPWDSSALDLDAVNEDLKRLKI